MPSTSGNDPEFDDAVPKPSPARRFRLRNVLVPLGIIALLVAFLLPANRSSRPAAQRMQCTNNLKQIMLALANYEARYEALPPACTVDATGRPLHSWRTLILPYLDEDSLYRTIDLSKPWDDPANAEALRTTVPAFVCPSATGPPNTTTYLAIATPDGYLDPNRPRRLAEYRDGLGATLAVIEAGEENAVPWMAPVDADESLVLGLGPATKLHHAGGMNASFGDGRVTFLKDGIAPTMRRALMTIAGGEDFSKDVW